MSNFHTDNPFPFEHRNFFKKNQKLVIGLLKSRLHDTLRNLAFLLTLVFIATPYQAVHAQCLVGPCPEPEARTMGAKCEAVHNEEQPVNPLVHPANTVLYRHVLDNPDAVCNDGSPAVFYYRTATTMGPNRPAQRDKWVVVFEGGGTGFDSSNNGSLDSGMTRRWGQQDPSIKLDCAHKLSTEFLGPSGRNLGNDGVLDMPPEVVVGGILSPGSSFSTWNWVYINYCSSDHYLGTTALDLLNMTTTNPNGSVNTGHRIHFQGRNIVNAVLDVLQRRTPSTEQPPPEAYPLPDIGKASVVVLAGDSAGGGGVQNNLDHVHQRLNGRGARGGNPLLQNDIKVVGAIGASHAPSIGILGQDSWYIDADGNSQDDFVDGAKRQIEQVRDMSGQPDTSCMQAFAADDQWQCIALASVEPYLEQPHLVRQDMTDPMSVNDPGQGRYSSAQFRDGVTNDYEAWASSGRPVSIFAPDCSQHVAIGNSNFLTNTIAMTQSQLFGPPLQVTPIDYDQALLDLTLGIVTHAWDGRFQIAWSLPPAPIRTYAWSTLWC